MLGLEVRCKVSCEFCKRLCSVRELSAVKSHENTGNVLSIR